MPFEQHPTDPDKLVMRAGNYNLQKPWVGLTEEEQIQVAWSCGAMSADWLGFASLIEAKLKEKNT